MVNNDDDALEKYQCPTTAQTNLHNRVFFSESGSIFLGLCRLISFIILFLLDRYNRYLLRSKTEENTNMIPGLILPSYFLYIYLFVALSLVAGILDVAIDESNTNNGSINAWLIPFEQALFHWLYEGLAFFLMRYGAGYKAIKRALKLSALWGAITFINYFFLFSLYSEQFGLTFNKGTVYSLYIWYQVVLFLFYFTYAVVPVNLLYRRDALTFYARVCSIYYGWYIIFGTLIYKEQHHSICAGSIITFILIGVLQPLVLYRTLQLDSQYWQGIASNAANPIHGVWDHISITTAQSMGESLEQFNWTRNRLPVIPFGLIEFENAESFVAGGFSRVYFGRLYKEKVALKFLFAMELNPEDVASFYREATLLHSFRHENVVVCKGICIMPPAMMMVLEHCKFGSLYDFLHKPVEDGHITQDMRVMMSSFCSYSVDQDNTNPLLKSRLLAESGGLTGQLGLDALEAATSPRGTNRLSMGIEKNRSSSDSKGNSGSARGSFSEDRGSERERPSFAASISMLYENVASVFGGGKERKSMLVPNLSPVHYVPLSRRFHMMRDATAGIAHLHFLGYMHCDIKSLNFLVDENYRVKLADMGEVRPFSSAAKYERPPMPARSWAPPEVILTTAQTKDYNFKSEVFALCLILAEIMLMELPFGEQPDRMTGIDWYNKLTVDYVRPLLPANTPPQLKTIIDRGLRTEPEIRPSAEQVLEAIDDILASMSEIILR